jgi:hypothetical protein
MSTTMDNISSNTLEYVGGSICDVRAQTALLNGPQELNQYDFAARSPFEGHQTISAGQTIGWYSPTATSYPESSQGQGWQSPSASRYTEDLRGETQEQGSLASSGSVHIPNELSRDDLAAENARLKTMMAAMSAQLSHGQTAAGPETPVVKARSSRPQTTPRKRKASRVEEVSNSSSKRLHQKSPASANSSPGLIQAMWSAGVTPEQRREMVENPASLASITTPTPVLKKSRARAPKKAAKMASSSFTAAGAQILPIPQVSRSSERSTSELYERNFMSLTFEEKARILLPLLQGFDPATGVRLSEPGTLALEVQALIEQAASFEALAAMQNNFANKQSSPVYQPAIAYSSFGSATETPATEMSGENNSPLSETDVNSLLSFTQGSDSEGQLNTSIVAAENNASVPNDAALFGENDNNAALLPGNPASLVTENDASCSGQDYANLPIFDFGTPLLTEDTASFAENDSTLTNAHSSIFSYEQSDIDTTFASMFPDTVFDHLGSQMPATNAVLDLTATDNFSGLTADSCIDLSSTADSAQSNTHNAPPTNAYESMIQNAQNMIADPQSGAIRQREALQQHERRVAEGKRR